MSTHPKTGKPIKILQTETSTWKDAKTIVWLDKDTDLTVPWERYEVGAVGADMISPKVTVAVFITAADAKWILDGKADTVKIIFASKATLDAVGEEKIKELKITNLICLDEVGELFQFLGSSWDGTENDACLLASCLLRMGIVYGRDPQPNRTLVKVIRERKKPSQLWMISQYYIPPSAERSRELRYCLDKNIACPFIDRIVLLTEKDLKAKLPKSTKLQQDVIGKRLTYRKVIEWIRENVPDDVIVVFANSDIHLDDSWRSVWDTNMKDKFLSLLRYEAKENEPEDQSELFGPRADSQDTWALLSDSVKSRTWDMKGLDFSFGRAGCDNAINVEMLRAKMLVVNPALTLRTHHIHTSQIRTYDPEDIVDKPMYFYIHPTGLHHMNPYTAMPTETHFKKYLPAPFARPVHATSETKAKTFCTMVKRGEKYSLSAADTNTFTPAPIQIYKTQDTFQTPTGLGYSYTSLFVGGSKKGSEMWSAAQISGLSPSISVETGLIAPLPDEHVESAEKYMIHYLAKILMLRKEAGGKGEFWAPREKSFLDVLQLFNWGRPDVPVLPRDSDMQVWCKEAYILLPQDNDFVLKEHCDVLRESFRGEWLSTPSSKIVIFVDETYYTKEFITALEEKDPTLQIEVVWPFRTSPVVLVTKLLGAKAVLYSGDSWAWLWVAPRGAKAIEVQNEMEPSADGLHMARAAGLTHTLVIAPKGAPTVAGKANLLKSVYEELLREPVVEKKALPVLYMPCKPLEDFFGHAGDSFRETARMWEERGYVRIVEDKTITQVWLGGIGNILLYDRPTLEWLNRAPVDEKRYRVGLFGNPKPPVGGKSWSFWPRRPRMVEQLVKQEMVGKTFGERSQLLVFYGKVENGVQKERRLGVSWPTVCSEFVMPVGPSKEYPFTQEEYLLKLADAKFGLCLPGYGWKCHREVECMAMGSIPIVTPGVDMLFYTDPPVENVHYFVAQTPQDARRIAESMTEEAWATSSAACKAWWAKNSSVDGMWENTKGYLVSPIE